MSGSYPAPTFSGMTLQAPLQVASGGTGGTSQATSRTALGAAASGANSDISALSGLTTPLSPAQGGTGAASAPAALAALGGAAAAGSGSQVFSVGSPTSSAHAMPWAGSAVNVKWYGATGNGTTDDTTAVQSAINALPANGGRVEFPPGSYVISSTLAMGNGSGATASTKTGIVLYGQGQPGIPGIILGLGQAPQVKLLWSGGAAPVIDVNGPLQGWGVQNIWIEGSGTATIGLNVVGASTGDCANLTIEGCGSAIYGTSSSTYDSIHNCFRNTTILVETVAGAKGIVLTGVPANNANACYWNFTNTTIYLPSTLATFGLYLQWADSNIFNGIHFIGGNSTSTMVEFDYTTQANLPSSNGFVSIDTNGLASSIQFANSGTPNSGARPNWIKGLIQINNAAFPVTIPNLTSDLPQTLLNVALTGQTGSVSFGTLYTPFVTGIYRVSLYQVITTAGTAGTITASLTFTDGFAAKTLALPACSVTTVGGAEQAVFVFLTGTTIEYSVAFTSVTGSPAYSLYATVERIG